MNLILDLVVVLLFVLCAVLGFRKGALATLLSLVGGIAALAGAFFLAAPIGTFLSQSVVAPAMTAPVVAKLSEITGISADSSASLASVLQNPPAELNKFLSLFGTNAQTVLDGAEQGLEPVAKAIVTPVADMLSFAIAFFILLSIFLVVVRLLIYLARRFNAIPVLGGANRVLGLVLGALKGLVFAWVFCAVFYLVLPYFQSSENAFFAAVDAEKTYIFRFLHDFNPVTALTGTLFAAR